MDRRLFLAFCAAAPPGAALASAGGEKKKSGGSYVAIETLLGSTIRTSDRRGVLSVECGLDVPDAALRTRVEQSIPRLRSAYVQTVQAYAAGLSPGALPSPDYIGHTLQRQTDAILGRRGARVLLGAVVVN